MRDIIKLMKRLFYVITILSLVLIPATKAFAVEEDITELLKETPQEGEIVLDEVPQEEVDELYTDAETDNKVFESLEEASKNKTNKEDSLFGKVFHSKITRTDVPSYLLQDVATFKFEKGPIGKIEPFLAYRGTISALFRPEYSTRYDNLVTETGVMGELRNPNFKFRAAFFPIAVEHTNYAKEVFSDIYIMNTSIPHHQIYAGYSRIQTGMEGGQSTYTLPFVARSQIARNFASARSMAVKVVGNYQYLDYNFSVGSSSRNIIGGFPGAEFNSWVNIKPFGHREEKFGRLTIGGGYDGGRSGSHNYSVLSGYLGYKYKRLWTNFEVGIADGFNGNGGYKEQRACGYAYTLGWKFTPHWQLIGRVDQFDPDRSVSNNLKREYTVGLNWFIKGQALKVFLNYVFCQNQNMPNSQKIIIATQVVL